MRRFIFPCVPYYFAAIASNYYLLAYGLAFGRLLCCVAIFFPWMFTSALIDGVDECSPTISNSVRTTKLRLGVLVPLFVFVRRSSELTRRIS